MNLKKNVIINRLNQLILITTKNLTFLNLINLKRKIKFVKKVTFQYWGGFFPCPGAAFSLNPGLPTKT